MHNGLLITPRPTTGFRIDVKDHAGRGRWSGGGLKFCVASEHERVDQLARRGRSPVFFKGCAAPIFQDKEGRGRGRGSLWLYRVCGRAGRPARQQDGAGEAKARDN
jgi:hypothetical protein